ncbi:hypothetical protein B0H19DRAFT_1058390 [Mycena capillaripes]|nr:hypothetical protein B0H19DRAFT_1058390 [Mycena capillaripes]
MVNVILTYSLGPHVGHQKLPAFPPRNFEFTIQISISALIQDAAVQKLPFSHCLKWVGHRFHSAEDMGREREVLQLANNALVAVLNGITESRVHGASDLEVILYEKKILPGKVAQEEMPLHIIQAVWDSDPKVILCHFYHSWVAYRLKPPLSRRLILVFFSSMQVQMLPDCQAIISSARNRVVHTGGIGG